MPVEIQIANNHSRKKIKTLPFKRLIEQVITDEELPAKEITVIFSDNETLRKLHKIYLNDDTETDVITFNLSEGEEVEGEIYISVDLAGVQAGEYNVSLEAELARLIIHGLLHLKGYDDATPLEQHRMRLAEEGYLKKLNFL